MRPESMVRSNQGSRVTRAEGGALAGSSEDGRVCRRALDDLRSLGILRAMTDVATKTTEVYRLLADLSPEERRRVFSAVGALCGDVDHGVITSGQSTPPPSGELAALPAKAARWLTQNKISME